mgnify:CR=1 FL=1
MSNKHFVITIERQYGSGGRLTGKRLAEELGIHFYDEEILKMTSETSAIGEQYFRLADEKAGNNLLYRDRHEAGADRAGEGWASYHVPGEPVPFPVLRHPRSGCI